MKDYKNRSLMYLFAVVIIAFSLTLLYGCTNDTRTNNAIVEDNETNNSLIGKWQVTHLDDIPANQYYADDPDNAGLNDLDCTTIFHFKDSSSYTLSFNCKYVDDNGISQEEDQFSEGTYSTEGDSITLSTDRYKDAGQWIEVAEDKKGTETWAYNVSGNALTLKTRENKITCKRI